MLESTVRLSELAVDEKQVEIELEKARLEALRMGNEEELLRIERLKQLYKSTNPEDIAAMKNYSAKGAFAQTRQTVLNEQALALDNAKFEAANNQFRMSLIEESNKSYIKLATNLYENYGINTADWLNAISKTTRTMIDYFDKKVGKKNLIKLY